MRDDYVKNSNDSYWLTNPAQPLTGFNKIIGCENCDIGLRPRLAIIQLQQQLAKGKLDLPTFPEDGFCPRAFFRLNWRATTSSTTCARPAPSSRPAARWM